MDKSVSLVFTAPVRSSKRVSGGKGVKWGNSEQSIILAFNGKVVLPMNFSQDRTMQIF